jgi:hypothetical protein
VQGEPKASFVAGAASFVVVLASLDDAASWPPSDAGDVSLGADASFVDDDDDVGAAPLFVDDGGSCAGGGEVPCWSCFSSEGASSDDEQAKKKTVKTDANRIMAGHLSRRPRASE